MFFSFNKAVVEDDCVLRRIYAYLTAHVTGLDQRYARVYLPPPPMSEMMNLIQAALLRSGYDLKGLDIDMVTCKVYYTYFDVERQVWDTKVLNSHTDVKYRPDGSVVRDNAQGGCLPVVIYNIGDPKKLHFQLKEYGSDRDIQGAEFFVRQANNHCFVLNALDEVPGLRGLVEKVMSYWAHSSCLEEKEGISISLQFRFGNRSGPVRLQDDGLAKTCQSVATDAKFDNATWKDTEGYKDEFANIQTKLFDRFG